MKLNFTKMQGAGNDYIYIDCRAAGLPPDAAAWAVQLSRRHFSVGADGVIYLCPPLRADGDAAMRMFNADGSEGVMCGNGVRCAAEFLYTHGVRRDCIRIDTPSAGQRVLHRVGDGLWQVEMGRSLYGSTGRRGGRGAGRWTAAGCAALRRRARVEGALCSRGQPALRTLYARAAARRGGAGRLGPCAGTPPGVPGRHQCGVCPAHQPHRAGCDGVGARQRGHAGLRDRGLRRGRGGGADRPLSARRAHFSTAAGRHAGGVCTAGRHRAFDRRRRSNI